MGAGHLIITQKISLFSQSNVGRYRRVTAVFWFVVKWSGWDRGGGDCSFSGSLAFPCLVYCHVWTCPGAALGVRFRGRGARRVVGGVRWCSGVEIVANCGFHPCFCYSSQLWNYFFSCLTPVCKLPLDCSFDPEALYTPAHLVAIMLLYVGVANWQETIAM